MHPNVRPARGEYSALRAAVSNSAIWFGVQKAAPVKQPTDGSGRPDLAAYWKPPSPRRRDSQNILPPAIGHMRSKPECARLPIPQPGFESRGLVPWGAKRGPQLRCGRRYKFVDARALALGGRLG